MMIRPQAFYDTNIKGKSAEEIKATIIDLKSNIERLKRCLEHPDYRDTMCPSEDVRLSCSMEYLSIAAKALAEAGGKYPMSEKELEDKDLRRNIDYIERLVFEVSDSFGAYDSYTVLIEGDDLHTEIGTGALIKHDPWYDNSKYAMTKDNFFGELLGLHIGEWDNEYTIDRFKDSDIDRYSISNLFPDVPVCSNPESFKKGICWNFTICFSNGRKNFVRRGKDAYPYNFKFFKSALRILCDKAKIRENE